MLLLPAAYNFPHGGSLVKSFIYSWWKFKVIQTSWISNILLVIFYSEIVKTHKSCKNRKEFLCALLPASPNDGIIHNHSTLSKLEN